MRNVSDKIVQKIKTHFTFSNHFSKNRAVYDIMWEKFCIEWGQETDENMAHVHCMLDN